MNSLFNSQDEPRCHVPKARARRLWDICSREKVQDMAVQPEGTAHVRVAGEAGAQRRA